jgi:flagellar biosynthesis/type III secretory pathway ATPase
VINALGVPIDAAGPLHPGKKAAKLDAQPPQAMRRAQVRKPLKNGVRVIDLFTPVCAGANRHFCWRRCWEVDSSGDACRVAGF